MFVIGFFVLALLLTLCFVLRYLQLGCYVHGGAGRAVNVVVLFIGASSQIALCVMAVADSPDFDDVHMNAALTHHRKLKPTLS